MRLLEMAMIKTINGYLTRYARGSNWMLFKPELINQPAGIMTTCAADPDDFNKVQVALSPLVFGNKTLLRAKLCRQLLLREPSRNPDLPQGLAQFHMSLVVDVDSHGGIFDMQIRHIPF